MSVPKIKEDLTTDENELQTTYDHTENTVRWYKRHYESGCNDQHDEWRKWIDEAPLEKEILKLFWSELRKQRISSLRAQAFMFTFKNIIKKGEFTGEIRKMFKGEV